MDQLRNPKFIFGGLLFVVFNSLVVGGISDLAVGIWGRPRGVAFGIALHFYWIGLSVYAIAMVIISRLIPVRFALLVSISIITAFTVWIFPYSGWRTYLSVYVGAVLMCLLLGGAEHQHRKRR